MQANDNRVGQSVETCKTFEICFKIQLLKEC